MHNKHLEMCRKSDFLCTKIQHKQIPYMMKGTVKKQPKKAPRFMLNTSLGAFLMIFGLNQSFYLLILKQTTFQSTAIYTN